MSRCTQSKTLSALLALLLGCVPLSSASAATLGVPADFPTIQAAINAAANGDTIEVGPGVYEQAIDYSGKTLTIRSTAGPAATVLSGNLQTQSNVTVASGEGAGTSLIGFKLTAGKGTIVGFSRRGLALYVVGAQLVVEDCIFEDNTVAPLVTDGGAAYCESSTVMFLRCSFTGCVATAGGGVYGINSTLLTIEDCYFSNCATTGLPGFNGGAVVSINDSQLFVNRSTFEECSAAPDGRGGALFTGAGSLAGPPNAIVTNCLFDQNTAWQGAGLWNTSGRLSVTNCTLVGNSATNGGSAIYGESATISNSIIWGNGPSPLDSIITAVNYSVVQGGWAGAGSGNLNVDPQLLASPAHSLAATSPCIDAGDNTIDIDPWTPGVQGIPNADLIGASRFEDNVAPDTGVGPAPIVDIGCYELPGGSVALFARGDVNSDNLVNIADAIALIAHLFQNGPLPSCLDAADANDDSQLNIADVIQILAALFSGQTLPAPGDTCGPDPTLDNLDCATPTC